MDSTFVTTMGMSEWGDEQNSQANDTAAQGENDRLQMPCLLIDLLNLPPSEEKISYGSYTFSTIRVVGQIVNITETENHELHYEITDPDDKSVDGRTVHGTIYAQARKGTYSEGDWMMAYAKLRSFDGALNLLTFAVRPADLADVALNKAQARCAKFYYRDDGPEKILHGVVPEYMGTPLTNEKLSSSVKSESANTPQFGAPFNIPNSFPRPPQLTPINAAPIAKNEQKSSSACGTRDRIKSYFKEHENSLPKDGFHMEDIKRELGNPANFENEIFYLLNEGVLFNTHDSNHFTMI
ncbi:hypothetical protein M3Y98_00443500 [Aphelenchoides besseyi]|nr:hypothetical protein M3Y98_00443500 [Aphelenchoides besseyi]KAI6202568.1 hypothetical protein M3Y96_00962600 [Aphelenchoides besseyi]